MLLRERDQIVDVEWLLQHARRGRLDPAAERDLLRRAQSGDVRSRDEVIRRYLRLVVFIAQRHGRGRLPLEDRVQEGLCGLLRAIDLFDGARLVRFSTYAAWWIRACVLRSSARAPDAAAGEPPLEAADDRPSAADQLMEAERRRQVRRLLASIGDDFGATARAVVDRRLALDEPSSLEDLGRSLGLSRERVRQVEISVRNELARRLAVLEAA